MKIGPTVDGRIKLHLDNEGDYYLLIQLIHDASGEENVENLVNQIGGKVVDEDWEEFIKPDLLSKFNGDILLISNQIKRAHDVKAEEIFISKKEHHQWYSTLNQARLHLENKHKLSEFPEETTPEDLSPEMIEPFIKGNFYTHLQGLILECLDW